MAKVISDEIQSSIKDLIGVVTHYEGGSDRFRTLERSILSTLRKSDTMYFLNTKDIKREVWSMAEKFMFHGFFKHGDYLKQCHDRYIDKNMSESDLTPRLNVVKFLLCMSQQPTNQFWKDPDKFEFILDSSEEPEVEDWGAYLNEGIDRWSPTNEESFQESSSEDETDHDTVTKYRISTPHIVIRETEKVEPYDFRACRNALKDTGQSGWYSGEHIIMKPPSEWFDANVGILWQQHLQSEVKGLIEVDPITVISEYKVMREVMWQMWGLHSSTVFEFVVNKLVPKPNVTISSVCSITFEGFLGVFMPYIEVLEEFRQFYVSLEANGVSETYRSYASAVRRILKPVLRELLAVEDEIREQETTMTLLKLAERFEHIFQPALILREIHKEVIIGHFKSASPLECALTLLTRLRSTLEFSVDKMEQDIHLTLYLESLFYYLTMTNAWFLKNDLYDPNQEFVIVCKDSTFSLQDNIELYSQDGLVSIISDQVLQIGRNIHLLRLLGKYDVFSEKSETIHQEFVRKVLEELASYYGCDVPESQEKSPQVQNSASSFDMNQMGDWTSFVDMTDGFLAKAFEEFHYEEAPQEEEKSLFDRISAITTNLFPLQNLPEKTLMRILKDRFTISGLMVKTLLIENYNLDKQFKFLNHIFLFWDDMIFPFYRKLFQKMNTPNCNWGNSVWLTSHLQDLIMDPYPNFYEECRVQVKDFWKQCRDSIEACTLIGIHYEIKWPLSIIITKEHVAIYQEVFQFILKIKWALYAINHLFFADLEPKTKSLAVKRLKWLRFSLINVLNTIQHYMFGFAFTKSRIQFELDFERSNDLKSLIKCHEDFIKSIYSTVEEIRDKKSGFNTLLRCVKMLKVMWNDLDYARTENLEKCYRMYGEAFGVIDEIANPVFVFDY